MIDGHADPLLRWIVLLPLLAAAIHGVSLAWLRQPLPRTATIAISCGAPILAFVLAFVSLCRLAGMPAMSCVAPKAAFYVMPRVALPKGRTDEDYVLALLGATGILCVHGSGFGLPADQGYFRIVFLAPPDELAAIYDDMAAFTAEYTARG